MATDVEIERRTVPPLRVTFQPDEIWEIKQTDHLVLFIDGERRVRAAVNVADFISAKVVEDDSDAG